jgi:FkbH-like protein
MRQAKRSPIFHKTGSPSPVRTRSEVRSSTALYDVSVKAGEFILQAINRRVCSILARNAPAIIESWHTRQFDRELIARWGIVHAGSDDLSWLKSSYVRPALALLLEYVKTGEDKYLSVYLDERLRYAPHRRSTLERAEFFRQVIPGDAQDLLRCLEGTPDLKQYLEKLLATLHQPLLAPSEERRLEVLALGDCLMAESRIFISRQCSLRNLSVDMRCIYFSATENSELSLIEVLPYFEKNKVDAIAISFFTFDAMRSYSQLVREHARLSAVEVDSQIAQIIQSVQRFLLEMREHTQAPFLIHNASGLPLSRARKFIPLVPPLPSTQKTILEKLSAAVEQVIAKVPNCLLVDERGIANKHGLRAMAADILPRRIRKGAFFHTSCFGEKVAEVHSRMLAALATYGKVKAVLVDFDNTLWKGVMAEGEVEHYRERQKLLLRLKEAGILLVSVSKNSPSNIRWSEMTLQSEEFALHKISWDLKAQSIRQAAEELNLGLDSYVFVDDDPAELELVRGELPSVLLADANDPDTWQALEMMLQFPNTQMTAEARTRTAMYQEHAQRQVALKTDLDYPRMMASLALEMTFRPASNRDLARLFELVNRTNQFNTTTLRLSKGEIKEILTDSNQRLFVAELKDKFGNLGLVGVMIVELRPERAALVKSFILSCRAIGLGFEQQMLTEVMTACSTQVDELVGRYVASDRNTPCREVFKRYGFSRVSDSDWSYRIGEAKALKSVPWITVSRE